MFAQCGQETYTRDSNVYTTLQSSEQNAAYQALRQGVMDYERRQVYTRSRKIHHFARQPRRDGRGPVDAVLDDHPTTATSCRPVVLEARTPKKIVAVRQNAEQIEITGRPGLRRCAVGFV
jgi:penicillin-binding protein 1A